ncbi:VOC family protein [Aestuariicoccus sp. MJ-SS9]|uniref:VOC family protein n=1 Tax=Aestuariicoccus sp. MJ-SS9 TaxID=3079855 RepID=UPI0029062C1B|nr:VOC family protein [Aestuariicoccus sp. MJ-SS9]MDU8912019.1 VOC family protein [Aestuariicoccus sp. MJ-SS9]
MRLNPYLSFGGNAATALHFYARVLDGEVASLMKMADMPDQSWVTDANREMLAHGHVTFEGGEIHASDMPGAEGGYRGVTLQINCGDPARGKALFDRLAEGGEVTMAFAETFWAKGFGTCTDRFGVPWMVNCQ